MTQNDAEKTRKNQLSDTRTVSLNPSLFAQKWFLGPRPATQGLSRYVCMYVWMYVCMYVIELFWFNLI